MNESLLEHRLRRQAWAPGRPSHTTAPVTRSLIDVFAATVARHGSRTAIDAADRSLTYDELLSAAQALAARLRALGIGAGDRVGVRVASGTAELYVAILGVLHAGAAYVPVDADDPEARASAIWESAGACAMVAHGLRIVVLGGPAGPEAASGAKADANGSRAAKEPSVLDDAWVIFTSGSTGRPKGVAVSHRSAAAFVDAETRLWRVTPDDRVLAGLSVAFDASCEEMWLAWRNGATLVPAPRALVRGGAELGPWLAQRRMTRRLDRADTCRDVGRGRPCRRSLADPRRRGVPRSARVASGGWAGGVEHVRADRGDGRQHRGAPARGRAGDDRLAA